MQTAEHQICVMINLRPGASDPACEMSLSELAPRQNGSAKFVGFSPVSSKLKPQVKKPRRCVVVTIAPGPASSSLPSSHALRVPTSPGAGGRSSDPRRADFRSRKVRFFLPIVARIDSGFLSRFLGGDPFRAPAGWCFSGVFLRGSSLPIFFPPSSDRIASLVFSLRFIKGSVCSMQLDRMIILFYI